MIYSSVRETIYAEGGLFASCPLISVERAMITSNWNSWNSDYSTSWRGCAWNWIAASITDYKFSCSLLHSNVGLSVHTREKSFACDQCDFRTHMEGCLRSHIRNKHTPDRPSYTCKLCGTTLTQQSELKLHMNRHVGLKNFKCPICNKAFSCEFCQLCFLFNSLMLFISS